MFVLDDASRRFFDCAPCGRSAQNDIVKNRSLRMTFIGNV